MATKWGIGFSNHINEEKTAREAASKAKADLGDPHIDLAIVFSTVHYNPQKFLPHITKILNAHRMIGCSTAGIILASSVETQGIGILVVNSQDFQFGIGSINTRGFPDTHNAGTALAQNCISDYGQHNRHGFLYFSDPRISNSSSFLKGLQQTFGKMFPIIGASSSDDFHFTQSFQLFENQTLRHSTVGLVLGGPITFGVGSAHGWIPLGKPRTVTKSSGNIIEQINGQKASSIYDEYFSALKDNTEPGFIQNIRMLYPLGLHIKETNKFILRNVSDELPKGQLLCQGDIPENSTVHIMISNKGLCIEAAEKAARQAAQKLRDKQPQLIIVMESLIRLKILGRSAHQEIDKIKDVFGENIPIIGMYSCSETYPFRMSDIIVQSHVQNESIVVMAIC